MSRDDTLLDSLMAYGPMLMLTLFCDSPHRAVRLFGLIAHFVWFLPVMAVCLVPILALIMAEIFHDAWDGQL